MFHRSRINPVVFVLALTVARVASPQSPPPASTGEITLPRDARTASLTLPAPRAARAARLSLSFPGCDIFAMGTLLTLEQVRVNFADGHSVTRPIGRATGQSGFANLDVPIADGATRPTVGSLDFTYRVGSLPACQEARLTVAFRD